MEYLSDAWETLLNNFVNKEVLNERARILAALEQAKVVYVKDPDKLDVLQEIITIVKSL